MKVYFGVFFLFLNFISVRAEQNPRSNFDISIDSVVMGSMEGDTSASEFSLKIKLTNHGDNILKWSFGFFMAGTPLSQFIKGTQNFNPRLIRRICNGSNNCVPLQYDKAKSVNEIDLSQGYTAIHSPLEPFPFLKGQSYVIEILHINQWGGGNASYFPQNFFILTDDPSSPYKNSMILKSLYTQFSTYSIVGYDQAKINAEVQKHVKRNWTSSKTKSNDTENTIVPSPVKLIMLDGQIEFSNNSLIVFNCIDEDNQYFKDIFSPLSNKVHVKNCSNKKQKNDSYVELRLINNPGEIDNNPEGYTIDIGEEKVLISAINKAGIYYAFQTLKQIWNSSKNVSDSIAISQMKIIDYPRYRYRGILIDTARHFFTVKEIKRFIDLMAEHKLNTLHLHLSDDEAFRIDIPTFPDIKAKANERKFGILLGPMMLPQGNLYNSYKQEDYVRPNNLYSGVYTPDDIFELVKYANDRQITIIPEIDIPAHARALIKSMPSVFVDPNDKSEYLSVQGYWDNVIPVCTYNEDFSVGPQFTQALNEIINYIGNVFNNQTTVYAINNEVSIGGDEVSPNAWTNTSSCKGDWLNLSALQKSHKFFKELAESNPIIQFSGWQQLVQTDSAKLGEIRLPENRVGHVWVWDKSGPGVEQAVELIKKGYPTVLAFSDKTYFDLVYTPDIRETGFSWASKWSDTQAALSSAVSANIVEELTHSSPHLFGIEGALWSEHLANFNQLVYMSVPKMAGLSEASWSLKTVTTNEKGEVNWQSLSQRLGCGNEGFLSYLHQIHGIRYRGYPKGISLEVPKNVCHR